VFFPLVDDITSAEIKPPIHTLTSEGIQKSVFAIAQSNGHLPEPGSRTSVEMSLALHVAAPKIEAFYQHYADHYGESTGGECGSWVDWYGEVVCDVETLVNLTGIERDDSSNL
jgi:UDP-glucose:glycoprotein glucosyltransferase